MSAGKENAGKTVRRTVGRVVSSKMNKSVTVSVEYRIKHPAYGKFINRTTKIMAHDEENACKAGDVVAISECRPISKRKNWRVVEIISRAEADADADAVAGTEA
jgi:small subunit ribosomal protein S17